MVPPVPAPTKVYFPNLNGLRVIAAGLVVVHHIEQLKHALGWPSRWGTSAAVEGLGAEGVSLFFVLSGYLITYLLLAEEQRTGTIAVTKFYVRRVLRIWPLYFAVVLAALFLWPALPWTTLPGHPGAEIRAHLGTKLLLYATFSAGLVTPLFGLVPHASQTWSIGTEEQFYALWPVLVRSVRRHRLALMVAVTVGVVAVRALAGRSLADAWPGIPYVRAFLSAFQVDRMGLGGALAVLLFHQHRVLRVLLHPALGWVTIACIAQFWATGESALHLHRWFYAPLYALLILNVSAGRIRVPLESRVLTYLGDISYGLYMLHSVAILVTLHTAAALDLRSDWLVYPLAMGLTIGLAAASRQWLEEPFLRWKHAFTVVPSGARSGRPPQT